MFRTKRLSKTILKYSGHNTMELFTIVIVDEALVMGLGKYCVCIGYTQTKRCTSIIVQQISK